MGLIKEDCTHLNFFSDVKVCRLTEVEGGPVTGYSMDVQVYCKDCMRPFQFIGLPYGYSPSKPMMSMDATEARMPIKPV